MGVSHSNETTERPKSKDTWNFKEGVIIIHRTYCNINAKKSLKSIRYLTWNTVSLD